MLVIFHTLLCAVQGADRSARTRSRQADYKIACGHYTCEAVVDVHILFKVNFYTEMVFQCQQPVRLALLLVGYSFIIHHITSFMFIHHTIRQI